MCLPERVSGITIQRIVAVIGNFLCLNFGILFGITPAHIQLYEKPETPLVRPISDSDSHILCSCLFLCAAIGALMFGLASQRIGQKAVLLLSGLLQIGSWGCIHFATNLNHIYASRVFGGIAAGATLTSLPIFISEISEKKSYGGFCMYTDQWRVLGILIGLICGKYLPYDYISLLGLGISFIFSLMFPFSQESPYHYLRQRNIALLEKSLRWYRGIRCESDRDNVKFVEEVNQFKQLMNDKTKNENKIHLKSFLHPLIMVGTAHLSGAYVILVYAREFYATRILKFGSSPIDVETCILGWALIQFIGCSITVLLWPHFKSKVLLFVSAFICALSLIGASVYEGFKFQMTTNSALFTWVPFLLIALFMFFSNLGMSPLATLAIADMESSNLKIIVSSIIWTVTWLLLFIFIQFFDALTQIIDLAGCFSIFACICLILAIYSLRTRFDSYQISQGYEK